MMSGTPAVLYFPATWNLTHHPPWLRSQRRMVACKEASERYAVIAIHYVQVVLLNLFAPAVVLFLARLRLVSVAAPLDLSELLELPAVPALPYGGCGRDDFALGLAQIESRGPPRHIPAHGSHNVPQAPQARRREGVYDVRSAALGPL